MIYKTKQEKLNACKTDNHNLIVKQLNYEHIISKQERSHTLLGGVGVSHTLGGGVHLKRDRSYGGGGDYTTWYITLR